LFLEFEALQVLKKRMMEGNVAAAKAILEIARASNAPKTRAPSQADKQSKLGKKETLRRDAEAPPTSWGDLLN
jgi:dihydrodipicolinate synthase/N-acetylneuraminate lyase